MNITKEKIESDIAELEQQKHQRANEFNVAAANLNAAAGALQYAENLLIEINKPDIPKE